MSETGKVSLCLNCAIRHKDECPMRFVELFYRSDWEEFDEDVHDNTRDDGFCDRWRHQGNEAS